MNGRSVLVSRKRRELPAQAKEALDFNMSMALRRLKTYQPAPVKDQMCFPTALHPPSAAFSCFSSKEMALFAYDSLMRYQAMRKEKEKNGSLSSISYDLYFKESAEPNLKTVPSKQNIDSYIYNLEVRLRSLGVNIESPKSENLAKREALARDQGQCTHFDEKGNRCGQTRYVHLHHVQPKELEGPDTVENLVTLCSYHHRTLHARLTL